MASILDNFTFAKLIQNFVISAVSKAVPTMSSFIMVGSNTGFSKTFFDGGGVIPIVATTAGRNTQASTVNIRVESNTIYFPVSYNWMMVSITGSYWAETLNQIKSQVGPDAALTLTMNIIRVNADGTESALDSLQWTVTADEAPLKRLPVCINRGQGIANNSGLKFKISATLFPNKASLGTSYTDSAIFTAYPNLTTVGSLRHFDVLLWSGVRFNLINVDQEGG